MLRVELWAVMPAVSRGASSGPVQLNAFGRGILLLMAICCLQGCYNECRRKERQAIALRSTLPMSQRESLARLKHAIPECLFVDRVKIVNDTVTELRLDTDARDTDLVALEKLPDLQVLSVNGSGITDAGLLHLRTLKKLRYVALSKCATGSGLEILKDLPELCAISISNGENVTDDMIVRLSQMEDLESLKIQYAPINDEAVKKLSALKRLKCLNICGCRKVTDQGLAYLMECPSLQELVIVHTGISPEGKAAFQRVGPKCVVHD